MNRGQNVKDFTGLVSTLGFILFAVERYRRVLSGNVMCSDLYALGSEDCE